MLPAPGMEAVQSMKLEEVWEKIRKRIRSLSAKERGWAYNLGRRLKAGDDVPEWQDEWARRVLIDIRTPVIVNYIDEDDVTPDLSDRATNYRDF